MDTVENGAVDKTIYFVMNPTHGGWIRVSREFATVGDAQQELESLRSQYPFARLGGHTTG